MNENMIPKVLNNILNIGNAYKLKGDFEEAFKTFEEGLKIQGKSSTDEYQKIKKEYDKLKEINENFRMKSFDSYDDFLKSIVLNDKDIGIEVFNNKKKTQDKKDANNLTDEIYIMPTEDKIKAIGKMLTKLQKNNPKIDIKKIFIGDKEYKDFVVMPIEATDFSIFENFKTDNNLNLFFVKNDKIDIIPELTKPIVSKFNGVIPVNHVNSNENYIANLVENADELIKETETNRIYNENSLEIDVYEPEDLIDEIPEVEIENIEEDLSLDEYEPTDLIDENPEMEIFEFDKEPEVENNEIQEEVETEEFQFEDTVEENKEEVEIDEIQSEDAIEENEIEVEIDEIQSEDVIENKDNEIKETENVTEKNEDEERKYLIKLISSKIAVYRQAKQEYNAKNERYNIKKAEFDVKQKKLFKDNK